MTNPTQPILALDPGLRDLGFAVLSGRRLVASGVRPLRLLPRERRLTEARRLVHDWIGAYGPQTLVIERTNAHPVPWLNDLNKLARSVRRLGNRRDLVVATYSPQTVRKAIAGNGWATKKEVAVAVALRFPALRAYLTQDRKWKERYFQNMFDAIALALHHQGRRDQPPSRSRFCG